MSDTDAFAPDPDSFEDTATRSQEAGIADETAAFEGAAATSAPSVETC